MVFKFIGVNGLFLLDEDSSSFWESVHVLNPRNYGEFQNKLEWERIRWVLMQYY